MCSSDLPEFLERDPQAVKEKEQRLAPIVDQVMARKPAEDHPPLPTADYAFPAIPRAIADRSGSDDFHKFLDQVAEDTALGDNSVIENALRG